MELWNAWLGLLDHLLHFLATDVGLGMGLAIIVMTLALRTAMLPLTWSLARRGAQRQAKLAALEPQLKIIRERYAKDSQEQVKRTMDLYREHGLGLADMKSLMGAILQMPVISGLYQTLRSGLDSSAFLWVRNLSRPDLFLAILAAAATALSMAVAPNMSESMRVALILLPALFCLLGALHFSSGISLYWITSNVFAAFQTVAVRHATRRRNSAP
jgi:YidC/Oxa1 family membrane protein insertase